MISSSIKKIVGTGNRFRDPIYGFICISDDEKRIVDTRIFQRLRKVHQLALEKYVYTGAEHTRFGHSLGVLHTATKLLESLFSEILPDSELFSSTQPDTIIKTLRFAALLHDVGHLPFSHGTESVLLPDGIEHEHISAYIVENHPEISGIIKSAGVLPESVASLFVSRKGRNYSPFELLLKTIVSGHLDADRADYLLRDSYYCGVKYGVYDFDRYLGAMKLKIGDDGSPQIYVKSDDVPIVEEFLLARYHYTVQVPYHRTRTMYDMALGEFVKGDKHSQGPLFEHYDRIFEFDGPTIESMSFCEFETFNDYTFFRYLDEYSDDCYWANVLKRDREHLCMIAEGIGQKKDTKRSMEAALRVLNEQKMAEGVDFFLWNPKLFELQKFHEETEPIMVYNRWGHYLGPIDNYSVLFDGLENKALFMWRIYVKSEMPEKVRIKLRNMIANEGRRR